MATSSYGRAVESPGGAEKSNVGNIERRASVRVNDITGLRILRKVNKREI
jgi:hypothetical protein